ncbi:STAS-like domain-containing protein [Xanthomonas arboricola]|uniref:STAS-like domain-containing protein n=1 Tax=Xanthomonas arboricola TaxID=56448 RepID=UPI0036D9215F
MVAVMVSPINIYVGKDFSRFPTGRYATDGESNGERFREEVLRPKLAMSTRIRIHLDDALGYGSSFLEESFGGLIRTGFTKKQLDELLEFVTSDDSLREEIEGYMREASC